MKKNKYQAYYTKSDPILSYMVGQLKLPHNGYVLEPCGGDGVFVDEVKKKYNDAIIDVFELNPAAAQVLREKYSSDTTISITETDTLLNGDILQHRNLYDAVIGNPPYGAKDDDDKKELLATYYPGLYIKESYTLFLYTCLRTLKNDGVLCFIIPDTFLFLHRHKAVREFLLLNSRVEEILLFPSSFFPGVNFGYSNLCIVTLRKCTSQAKCLSQIISVKQGFNKVEDLTRAKEMPSLDLKQRDVYEAIDSTFFFSRDEHLIDIINNPLVPKIGDIASCVTGFYSGNDKCYLHPKNESVKNAKKYVPAQEAAIIKRDLSQHEKLFGLKGSTFLVPIVKGGNKQYYKPTEWYMDWSEESVQHYKINKASRFQNSSFYFKEAGIAIPMIRSHKLTAALIEKRLIDQSIVGVFLNDAKYENYVLGFFNSNTCTKIVNVINPSTNNSANYIKKIPFIYPSDEELNVINTLVQAILKKIKNGNDNISEEEKSIDAIFKSIYGL